jgi:hypothetical protein
MWLAVMALSGCGEYARLTSTQQKAGAGASIGVPVVPASGAASVPQAGATTLPTAGRVAAPIGATTAGTTAGSAGTGIAPMLDAGAPNMPADGGPITANGSGYKDPGQADWAKGTADECKMDPTLFKDSSIGVYAVFRYGKLCHIKGGDAAGSMFSATKTLGGTMIGRAAYLARDVPKTGPGTGPIKHEDLGTDWIASPTYPRRDATTSHIMGMVAAASPSLDDRALVWRYDTVGSEAINTMITATEKCVKQVPGLPTSAVAFVKQEIFDRMGMKSSSWERSLGIASGWTANLSDMGKLGTLLLHDGWYGGERLLSTEWVYRMSHPNFESANTSYGQLAWLNHRGNAEGIGGNISTGSNAPGGDPCAPAAFWPSYPHGLSKASDCLATAGAATCKQMYDVGIFSAQGLNGQFIVVHPGLDMVIAARNFSGGDGPMGLWNAIRPGIVAKDPMFKGDEAAFCAAYGGGNYAPDLVNPRHP